MEAELPVAVNDGVARVAAALIPRYYVEVLHYVIGYLPLTLIPPLAAHYGKNGHDTKVPERIKMFSRHSPAGDGSKKREKGEAHATQNGAQKRPQQSANVW